MKKISAIITGTLLIISNSSYAEEYFCVSNHEKPRHCYEGDIILVKPTMMPRVCDFNQQILRMPKNENAAEYVCRYTGIILSVKELKRPPKSNGTYPPPRKEKKKGFGSMPFFK
ncbi:MAG: hypothetical protein KZQ83_11170 [gamma proteobacterium symbiont of Taylorina sp.]|nr:hypothetical protein [gamma proteobacterium symbiont of Taylorina sp.]